MDPITAGLIASALGGLLEGVFSPRPQKKQSYTGTMSPQHTLETAMGAAQSLYGDLAGAPFPTLRSSYVQDVPGLSGSDPALHDPSLLSLPSFITQLPDVAGLPNAGPHTRGDNPATGQAVPRVPYAGSANAPFSNPGPRRLSYGTSAPTAGATPTLDPRTRAAVDLVLNYGKAA